MAAIFYVLGYIVVALGLAWATLALFVSTPAYDPSLLLIGRLIAATPGLSVIGAGLLLLAIGGVLGRLDRLVRAAEGRAGLPVSRGSGAGPVFD